MLRRLTVVAFLSLVLSTQAFGPAFAEDNAAIGKITLLNRQAIEEYQKLNFDEAQRLLDQALELAINAGLTQHPVRARTYVTLGVITAGGLKRQDVAVRLFRKALQIQPEIQLSKELATPEVQAAFNEAIQGLGSEPKLERSPSELLVHDPVTTAARGEAITVAATPDESLQADRLMLIYRSVGAPTFAKANMQKQVDGVFEGVIPAPATAGKQVEYYIEARNLDGKLVAARGSPVAPLLIALSGSPPVVVKPAESTPPKAGPPGRAQQKFVFGLLAGTGAGWISGIGETSDYELTKTKLAWSELLHLAPEIGMFVTPQLLIAVQGRLQLVTGAEQFILPAGVVDQCGGDSVCSPAHGAFAAFVKGAWFFSGPEEPFRMYASLAVGGGLVRHVVQIPAANQDCGPNRDKATCMDTIAAGPFLAGPGLGFHYELAPATHLVFALETLFGAPKFTIDIDADVGVAFAF